MNRNLLIVIISAIALYACGGKSQGGNLAKKKEELASLKADAKKLNDKIGKLEEEIAKLDTTADAQYAEVRTMAVAAQVFKTYIDVQGRVDADENVSLSTQTPGTIIRINVKVGQEVSKGQILAETDASMVNQQISDLQTNLDMAKITFKKQENLWNQKVGTEMQYLQAKTTKESLENKMNALQEQLRMSKIISPINGTVDAVNIKIGQQVMPGLSAITVVNFSNLKVKADVAESYSSRVQTGQEVKVFFPDNKDSFNGRIYYASRAINPLTRTFGVEILLGNDRNYHPNMVAKLKINDYSSKKPEVVIPIKYLQKGTNEVYVLVDENGVAAKKPVTISREYNGMAEIVSGLEEGDQLIIEGYDLVNEGDKITVKK